MKVLSKIVGVFSLIISFVFLSLSGILFFVGEGKTVLAETTEIDVSKHFYNQISKDSRAEKFYMTFENLKNSGQFKKGKVEYDLVDNSVVKVEDVQNYINNGDKKMVKAYGAGRDAFLMDNPDLFYVDLFKTSISAGQQEKNCVAYLDNSNALNLYLGGLDTEEKVNVAIQNYENKLNEIVNKAKASGGVKDQIEFVNKYIADNTIYSFGTSVIDGKNISGPEAYYIDTAYGSLVNGKAICGGYAKGFKAVMDRLDIPCVCVQGYSLSNDTSEYQAHMWNAVELEGMWYAVDVTWNDTSNQINKWLLVGGEKLSETHIEDTVISSSGFELNYPVLKPYDYGTDTDDNGMTIEGTYTTYPNVDGKVLELSISFEGKGAHELQKEGKYLSFRTGNEKNNEIEWGVWLNCIPAQDMFPSGFDFKNDHVSMRLFANTEYVQFALIDYAPDESNGATYPNRPEYGENAGKECFYFYKPENLSEEHFIGEKSVPYHNNGFGTYVPAPGASAVYPSNGGAWPVDGTYEMKFIYNVPLELVEGKTAQDVGMDFYTSRGNDTVKNHAVIENVVWDGQKTITFKFTPSKMYIHNQAIYYFVPTNLIGVESKKVPDPVTYTFKGKSVVCSKVFNDGRYYLNVFGAPIMLDNSDLSISDFKDESGNYYAESQRSQLLLVANKPSADKTEKMEEVLKRDTEIKDDDIVSSATYEINLQICGVIKKIPNGSYMQVAFGFPEGYSPDDEGTTFKIYHYKHDNSGNITGVEEIPVIVTEYGLIAKVHSFSPFSIVQLKNTSEVVLNDNIKNIYANVIGNGGSISVNGKSGIQQVTGNSITYDVISDNGFKVKGIVLNGKLIDPSRIDNGKLTLRKNELEDSNMLEVSFITNESSESYKAKGVDVVVVAQPADASSEKSNKAGIIIACVAVVLFVGAVFVLVLELKKKSR